MSTTTSPNLDYARRLIEGITVGIVTIIAAGEGISVRLADFGGHTRTLCTFYGDTALDRARAAANRAHNLARRSVAAGTNPDVAAIIADHIVSAAHEAAAEYGRGEGMVDEFVHIGTNTALGYCGDGCCGGPECMDEGEIPEFLAWENRLRAAVRNATA